MAGKSKGKSKGKSGSSSKWIQKATRKMEEKGTVGSLRKALGKKEGETISVAELQKAKSNPRLAKKANFALNVRKSKRR